MAEPREYSFCLKGAVPAKKNEKVPTRNRQGKMRFYNPSQTELDRLASQIPAEVRGLQLTHPDIEFHFQFTDGRRDRDNAAQTLIDLLKEMRVIKNDSTAAFNGTIVIHPAKLGEIPKTLIRITTAASNSAWWERGMAGSGGVRSGEPR